MLLGLLRASEHDVEHPFHIGAIRARLQAELGEGDLAPGDLGLALWADSRVDAAWVGDLVAALGRSSASGRHLATLSTLELGWALLGLVEAGMRVDLGAGEELLVGCRAELLGRRPSGHLLTHSGRGARRRPSSFADQISGLMALGQLARDREDREALDAGVALGSKLVELQLGDGAWPWLYDPVGGRVVEPYEVFSTHQDSLAMIGLGGLTRASGEESFRAAALRGLGWVFGENPLGVEMLDRSEAMLYRSIRRSKRLARVSQARTTAAAYTGRAAREAPPEALEVDRTMRPHQLGWILEAWVGKEELAQGAPE